MLLLSWLVHLVEIFENDAAVGEFEGSQIF